MANNDQDQAHPEDLGAIARRLLTENGGLLAENLIREAIKMAIEGNATFARLILDYAGRMPVDPGTAAHKAYIVISPEDWDADAAG